MIGRTGALAGALAGLVYLGLWGAYAVIGTWQIPGWFVLALGGGVVLSSAVVTEVLVARLEAAERSQDI